jgi:hypothetical protein
MMAKDGSVMLGLVASFQRVRALSQDFNMIMEVGNSGEKNVSEDLWKGYFFQKLVGKTTRLWR